MDNDISPPCAHNCDISILAAACTCSPTTCGVGTQVVLTRDYSNHSSAASGPLSPGDVGEVVLLSVTGRPNVQSDNGRTWFYEYEALMPTADFDDSSGSWEVSDGDSLADMLFHSGALYNNLAAALDIIRCKDGQMPLDHECFANGAFRVANADECAAVCSAILECHNFEVKSQ